jgi:hypothetical protein
MIFGGRADRNPQRAALISMLWPVQVDIPLIRLGGPGDGGYLVPRDLDGIEACFSPGVADRAEFEVELAKAGIRSFLIDGSIQNCPVEHELIDFQPLYLDGYSAEDRISLADWIESKSPKSNGDLLLQMDIEGYEWPSLLALPESDLMRFRIIVLEIHNLEHIFTAFGFRIINATLQRLLKHFNVVHAHPNNVSGLFAWQGTCVPNVLELTLLRKDRAKANGPVQGLPHELDAPSVRQKPELPLGAALRPNPFYP